MEAAVSPFPDDADALKALLATALLRADEAEQRAASVEAELANARALAERWGRGVREGRAGAAARAV